MSVVSSFRIQAMRAYSVRISPKEVARLAFSVRIRRPESI